MADIRDRMNEIIDETIEFYGEDPGGRRAKKGPVCVYRTPDGRSCAVGRCMIDPAAIQAWAEEHAVYGSAKGFAVEDFPDLDPLLKEEYRGLPVGFWAELQGLHDQSVHWNMADRCLSAQGRRWVRRMKEDIAAGRWDIDSKEFDND